MILADASALVAYLDTSQPGNKQCRAAFAEAMYLLYRTGGWPLQRNLWQLVEQRILLIHLSSATEQTRMRQLMEQYQDLPMALADASLVAAAEALNLDRILTLDAHFYVYRLNQTGTFDVIP